MEGKFLVHLENLTQLQGILFELYLRSPEYL